MSGERYTSLGVIRSRWNALSERIGRHGTDLSLARRLVPFFIARVLSAQKGRVALIVLLTVVSVAAQLGFLVMLPTALDALADGEATAAGVLPFDVPRLSVLQAGGAIFGLLLLAAISEFVMQRLVARTNIHAFRMFMRAVLDRLVEAGGAFPKGVFSTKQTIALFTKGARYGSLIGYRSCRIIRPLLAVPALLAFCIWQSPALTGLAILVYVLTAPLHLNLVQRGIGSMRRLMDGAVRHGAAKKDLVNEVMKHPSPDTMDVEALARQHIDDGSHDYLTAYYDRRLLAARSQLINLTAIAGALLTVFWLVSQDSAAVRVDVGRLLVLLLALRFLVTNVGQIVTDMTMIASYTPMCEGLYRALSNKAEAGPVRFSPGVPGVRFPHRIVFTHRKLDPRELTALARDTDGEPWADAHIVSVPTEPGVEGAAALSVDPLDPDRLAPDPITTRRLNAILRAAQAPEWTNDLWAGVSTEDRRELAAVLTMNEALNSGATRILLAEDVPDALDGRAWRKARGMMQARGVAVVQVVTGVPDALTVPVGAEAAAVVDGGVIPLSPLGDYAAEAPRLKSFMASRTSRPDDDALDDELDGY